MYVVACIKQVQQPGSQQYIMNPADAHALEACLRLKERYGFRVAAISAAPPHAEWVLRRALAVGADDVVLLPEENPSAVGHMLAAAIERLSAKEEVALVFCGQQTGEGDANRLARDIAGLLHFPLLSTLEQIESIDLNLLFLRVQCQLEDRQQLVEAPLPAVLTVPRAIHRLRYPTVPMLLAAEEAKIPAWEILKDYI